jgi:hypothetical protein
MAAKRQINGTKYSIPELVDNAITAVEGKTLDLDKARSALMYLGHRDPAEDLVIRYARESAILDHMARETRANFSGQIGKIDFSSREKTIAGVESYLNRRIAGQRARWNGRR